MSIIIMSTESIEKPKRSYVRKSKVIIDVPSLCAISTPLPSPEFDAPPKLKRTYSRKPKCVSEQTTNDAVENTPLPIPVLSRDPPICVSPQTTQDVLDGFPLDVIPPKEKKPRTEKQIAAFEKMRSARLSKQTELNDLKELERNQKQLQTEQTKLDKITEKVVAKATELKTKRVSKKRVVVVDDGYRTEPESIIRETKHKTIVFI